MSDRKGGCLCGAVRYVLKGEPRGIALCHCTHCQRQSGSLFSFNLVIRETDYEQSGETIIYVDSGDSGQPVHRHFCGRCGSPRCDTRADTRRGALLLPGNRTARGHDAVALVVHQPVRP